MTCRTLGVVVVLVQETSFHWSSSCPSNGGAFGLKKKTNGKKNMICLVKKVDKHTILLYFFLLSSEKFKSNFCCFPNSILSLGGFCNKVRKLHSSPSHLSAPINPRFESPNQTNKRTRLFIISALVVSTEICHCKTNSFNKVFPLVFRKN